MTDKLKPCPFCGAPAVNVGFYYITCGSGFTCTGHQVKADPEDWNKRTGANERLMEAFKDAAVHLIGAASAYRTYAKRSSHLRPKAFADALFTTRANDFEAAAERAKSVYAAITTSA